MAQVNKKPFVLCITGGIGSGKSLVSTLLSKQGIPVYHADKRAKDLYEEDLSLKSQVLDFFGDSILNEDQSINRGILAQKVFNNPELLEKLNQIVHPAVRNDYQNWLFAHQNYPIVAREVAILFESKSEAGCNFIVSISAPEKIRIQRVVHRDNTSADKVLDRIKNQWTDEERNLHAHFVIQNSGDSLLIPQVSAMLQQVYSLLKE